MTPKAFGPMMRIPYVRAWRTSARWRSRPAGPLSAYPAETTTRPCTRLLHSATTSGTYGAGTATTARSTGSAMSRTDRWAGTPSSSFSWSALFTASRPVKPAARRLSRTLRPATPPGVRPAPTTATEPGASSRCTDRASARCSPRALHGERAVGGFEVELQVYDTVLEVPLLLVPGVRERLDHLGVGGEHLGGETADVPLSGELAAMCSRRAEATPRPWWASCTRKATSASSAGTEAGRPSALIRS